MLIRPIEAGPWTIVAGRSLFLAATLLILLALRYGRALPGRFLALGSAGLLSAALLATTFALFVASVTRTAVANTLVVMATTPFVSALLGWVWLREVPPRRTWVAMAAAFAGVSYMFAGSLRGAGALGDLLALGVAAAFGANTVLLRRHRDLDMVPALCLGGVLSALTAAPLADLGALAGVDVLRLATLGVVQLAIGLSLFLRGTRHLGAAEAGLIGLLEAVFGPLWVWLAFGEQPARETLVGGGVALLAVVGHTLAGRGAARRSADERG